MTRNLPATVGIVVLFSSLFVAGCAEQPGGAPADQAAVDRGAMSRESEEARDEKRAPAENLRYSAESTPSAGPAGPRAETAASEAASTDAEAAPVEHSRAEPPMAADAARQLATAPAPANEPPPAGAEAPRLDSSTPMPPEGGQGPGMAGDRFDPIEENSFLAVTSQPLSTFSIDVDTASYAKTRRYLLQNGRLPPPDAVRIEEFINYFDYAYASPEDQHPFAVHVEMADCPWRDGHRIARIGIQGKRVERDRPASNLVFLIDVSGSMDYADKLPLVKRSLNMLTERLGENDRVAIVVYAGAAGLVLPSTTGDRRSEIEAALERLHAGGSTNGGQGIHLAYRAALDNFITGGVNRVLLCTDGDFNVGTTSTGALVRLAEEQARSGVFLSVLAFGQGNHNDAMLEQLSNKANGNYAFIDNEAEAYKVLVEQMSGTLVTIAKDVKLQVEFNPRRVAAYRLIGYENRKLADRDFNDDRKDAGEIGAGHQVTALYELIPPGEEGAQVQGSVDPLKYQKREVTEEEDTSGEWMTVKVRYKLPDEDNSTLLTYPVAQDPKRFGEANSDFQFASAVASFGMLLRRSEHRGDATYASVWEIASTSLGDDAHGYRREFLELVRRAAALDDRFPAQLPEAVSRTRPARHSPAHTFPVTHQLPPATAASQEVAWWCDILPERFLTTSSVFWMGASFGLLVACGLLFCCWQLPRMRLRSESPPAVKSLLQR